MAVVPIYNCFNPILREPTIPVTIIDDEIKVIINNLWDTLYAVSNGVGLAANQIGVNKRIVVIDTSLNGTTEGSGKILLINPEIIEYSEELVIEKEGCLSVPGMYEDITRAEQVKVRFFDINLNEHIEEYDGFLSVVMQHEIDHLNGKLFYDYFTPLKRTLTKNKLYKIHKMKYIVEYDMIDPDGILIPGEKID